MHKGAYFYYKDVKENGPLSKLTTEVWQVYINYVSAYRANKAVIARVDQCIKQSGMIA